MNEWEQMFFYSLFFRVTPLHDFPQANSFYSDMSAPGLHEKLVLSILWQLHDNGQELNGHGLLILYNLAIEAT